MKPIEKTALWKFMERLMSIILVIACALLVIIIGIAVFMRYVMNSTLFGNEEILALLAIWVYWIGGTYGSYEDSHISADMTDLFFRNQKVKRIVRIIVRGITVGITGIFAYWSIAYYAIRNITNGTLTTALRIPKVTSQIALTIAFCLMFLYAVYHLISEIHPMKDEGGAEE